MTSVAVPGVRGTLCVAPTEYSSIHSDVSEGTGAFRDVQPRPRSRATAATFQRARGRRPRHQRSAWVRAPLLSVHRAWAIPGPGASTTTGSRVFLSFPFLSHPFLSSHLGTPMRGVSTARTALPSWSVPLLHRASSAHANAGQNEPNAQAAARDTCADEDGPRVTFVRICAHGSAY